MKEEIILANDGYELCINIYEVENPKGVIQIAHGMEEHQKRYKKFATFLQENGYCVVTADMRGHGHHCNDLGFFKHKNGDDYLIEDQLIIRNHIEELYPNLPYYLFAHSMGTIIGRVFLQKYSSKYDKVVLCGYPYYNSAAGIGVLLANMIIFFKGEKYKSKLLKSLSTGSFNKAIKNPKTPYDWISYNEKNLESYYRDKTCGFGFTASGYRDLFKLMARMHKLKCFQDINENLKILLIRGIDDACAGWDKGANESHNFLLKAGFRDIKRIDYPKMRHEILNEVDFLTVYNDVLSFFDE